MSDVFDNALFRWIDSNKSKNSWARNLAAQLKAGIDLKDAQKQSLMAIIEFELANSYDASD